MFKVTKARTQCAEGLLPEPSARPDLIVKFFQEVSRDALEVRF